MQTPHIKLKLPVHRPSLSDSIQKQGVIDVLKNIPGALVNFTFQYLELYVTGGGGEPEC